MPKSKHRRENPRSKRRAASKAFAKRMKKNFPGREVVVSSGRDGIKMSEVLEEFVEPYSDSVETEDVYRKLLTLAVFAWNLTLLPDQDKDFGLGELLESLSEEEGDDVRRIIEGMMFRKQRFFPQHNRMIVGFELTDLGEGP